jgi:hypothetical protein
MWKWVDSLVALSEVGHVSAEGCEFADSQVPTSAQVYTGRIRRTVADQYDTCRERLRH